MPACHELDGVGDRGHVVMHVTHSVFLLDALDHLATLTTR